MGHSRFGRAFAALSVAFVMVFSFFSPALALTIDTNTYTNSLNGYSVPESVTINTGETVTIPITEPDDGNTCSISYSYSRNYVYTGNSTGSSYWGKPTQIQFTGRKAGSFRMFITIRVFDGPYEEGVTRTQVYDTFTIICDVTVVGEDYLELDPPPAPPGPSEVPIEINDTDEEQKTLVGFVEWMQARPGLTQQQSYDLERALVILQRAQNENFSYWQGGNNTGLPESRGGKITVVSDPSDAVSIINLQRSIQIMRDINNLRATDDIFTGPAQCNPARTNFYMMAVAATGADRGAGLRRHSYLQVSCENLAFGSYRNAANMWYREKSAFISTMNSMGMQSLSSIRDARTVDNTATSNGVTVGHYTNMFWAQDQIMGVGYTDYNGTSCYNASALSNYGNYGSYSIDEFEALLNEYLGLHNWDEGTVSMQATCVSNGLLIRTCTDCGATMMETIPAGHIPSDPVSENVTPATCTADGVCDEVVYCSYCGEELSRTSNVVIPATGHNLTHYDAAVNSCTDAGHIEYWSCSNCNLCFVDSEGVNEVSADSVTIPATGHDPVTDPAVAPSCTGTGLTEGSHCSICGTVLTPQSTVSALGHSLTYHSYTSPSETTPGHIAYYTCSRCDGVFTTNLTPITMAETEIPPTGHTLVHYPAHDPTCTGTGNIEYWRCSGCNRCFSDEAGTNEISASSVVVAATGHNPVTDPAVAPSETATGLTEGSHCSVCGTVLVPQSVVPALGGGTTQPDPDPIITPEEPAAPGTVNMYRLYNPNSGEHFYTADWNEAMNLYSLGWNYEGIGWTAPAYSNTPVYRLYNSIGGEHHYTTSVAERDFLISLGWNDENIGWYSDDAQTVPLYRQYNPNAFANNHNYTTSLAENDWLVSIGWRAEDIGWYGVG